jgi:hypothetical protein
MHIFNRDSLSKHQGALRMKHLNNFRGPFCLALLTAIFIHFFFLTNLKVEATEGFIGKVQQVSKIDRGMFAKDEVSFETTQFIQGELVKQKRVVKMVHQDPIKFKVGKTYIVKTHKDWLCSFTKS